ncbi:hypothetical protein MTBBW1_940008 [Desulfamplus magnetovallimortis]|uniref:Uncharacterized protein n=1 Tax=Desulfamplus magnetovallimortis TaxID=1246637 RepID=A0A1W1HL37_9BACT|nr:hypothetical protein [Desulfamplus magnetovallimortis]SLM33189.1 hypothetical protein MTBBW1_940008 [Desulfamplus magnetovallimortis]
MNNFFVTQFAENIKFNYTSFDRVIFRGYIRSFFSLGVVVQFLIGLRNSAGNGCGRQLAQSGFSRIL